VFFFAGVNEPSASRDLLLSLLGCCGVIISKEEFPLLVHTRTFHTLKVRCRSYVCCASVCAELVCAGIVCWFVCAA
jgi:hypothetical protein